MDKNYIFILISDLIRLWKVQAWRVNEILTNGIFLFDKIKDVKWPVQILHLNNDVRFWMVLNNPELTVSVKWNGWCFTHPLLVQ